MPGKRGERRDGVEADALGAGAFIRQQAAELQLPLVLLVLAVIVSVFVLVELLSGCALCVLAVEVKVFDPDSIYPSHQDVVGGFPFFETKLWFRVSGRSLRWEGLDVDIAVLLFGLVPPLGQVGRAVVKVGFDFF